MWFWICWQAVSRPIMIRVCWPSGSCTTQSNNKPKAGRGTAAADSRIGIRPMISSLLMLALLTVTDPAVGPSAAELLDPPSSALYRNLAVFDLQEVSVLESERLELRLQLGSYANPLDLVNG